MNKVRSVLSIAILTGVTVFGSVAAYAAAPLSDVTWSQGGTSITSYSFGTLLAGGSTSSQSFTLTDTSAKMTGDLIVSLSGSAQFSTTADTCTGQRLNKKSLTCEITVQYTSGGVAESDSATLFVSGKKVSAALSLTGVTATSGSWNRGGNTSGF